MYLKEEINIGNATIHQINDERLHSQNLTLDVLRLDRIHSVVSGNKWFKLKYYLQQASKNNYTTVATFGGPFSNHILATAYACNKQNLKCIGFIRGEEPKQYSQTLLDAKALNMQLEFLSREDYAIQKSLVQKNDKIFFINEGGYGLLGVSGTAEILKLVPDVSTYNYIVCAVGTGTMLAGIANASLQHQECIGISVMKNNFGLEEETLLFVDDKAKQRVKILHNYDFGGYSKHTPQLLEFMNEVWTLHYLPTDFVYNAKALYAAFELIAKNYFLKGSKILFIHSGGLQGNRSLKNILPF